MRVVVREDCTPIAADNAFGRQPRRPGRSQVMELAIRDGIDAIGALDLDGRLVSEARNRVGENRPEVLLWQLTNLSLSRRSASEAAA